MSRWYIGTDTGSKALAHYAKGASAKDHKWKTRSLRNGHWVYVYDGDGSKSEGTGSDSGSSNLDRAKNQTAQRKSMNAQAETRKNATQPWNRATFPSHADRNPKTPEDYDRLIKRAGEFSPEYWDLYEKYLQSISEQQDKNFSKVDTETKVYISPEAKKIAEETTGGDIGYEESWPYIPNVLELVKKYEQAGYKMTKNALPLQVRQSEVDARIVMFNPKTGKTVTLPTAREFAKSAKKQNAILSDKKNIDASNKASAANAQQRYAELTKSLPKQKTTPSAKTPSTKSHEVNSNGFKARPATAADADLFKNKSSAETKNKVTISDHGGNTGIKTEVTKKKKRRL